MDSVEGGRYGHVSCLTRSSDDSATSKLKNLSRCVCVAFVHAGVELRSRPTNLHVIAGLLQYGPGYRRMLNTLSCLLSFPVSTNSVSMVIYRGEKKAIYL